MWVNVFEKKKNPSIYIWTVWFRGVFLFRYQFGGGRNCWFNDFVFGAYLFNDIKHMYKIASISLKQYNRKLDALITS